MMIKVYEFVLKYPIKVPARSLKEAKDLLDEYYLVPDFNLNRFEAKDMKFSKTSKPTREQLRDYNEDFGEKE